VSGGQFVLKDGRPARHADDGEWVRLSDNPFGHGCCDCGLFHQVEWRVVDGQIELKYVRDEGETIRLRAMMKEPL